MPRAGRRGRTVGYVFRFPGLFAEAEGPDGVIELLPGAIAAENEWLAGHGVPSPHATEPVEIEEIERIDLATDVSRGIWRGLFQYELRPTTEADVELALERARFAREDLLRSLSGAPPEAQVAVAPRLVAHADAEWELLAKLGARLAGDIPAEPLARLAEVRARAEDRLRNLLPGDRERLAVFAGEKWTARKVLRCLAVAERRLLREVSRRGGA